MRFDRENSVGVTRDPRIKASYFQGNIDALCVLGADNELKARAALGDIIEQTAVSSRADWLPMAWDFELSRVVGELGGRDAVIALNTHSFLAAVEGPLLRPFIQGAFKLFGVTPRSVIRMSQKAWSAGTVDAGTMTTTFEDNGAVIVHTDVAAEPIWFDGFVGLLNGVFQLTNHEGETTVVIDGPIQATYTCRWWEKKKGTP